VHLKQKRRLHVLEAVAIAAQVLDALSAAHDIGVIHRDVKPANIFLVNGGGGVKLLDFGVAKIADATSVVTARGIAVGTPRYMSPEQARGERVDGRSDVYATGLILFEMIAGVGPYDDARDANELLLAHLAREAPPLSSLVMGVAPELERILIAMLAKDCRARPAHARVAAEHLREFAGRYRQLPATDAPTTAANYGAPTVVAPQSRNLEQRRELPTRPDGMRSASSPDLDRSDAALTQPIPAGFTTQVTVTVNTSDPLSTTAAPNTTYVSAPAFDGSTTLEMATLVPAYAASPVFAQAPSQYPPAERPERTEMLGEFTPAVPADAVVTRTHVPLVELGRPNSVTPPPVVDAGRVSSAAAPRAQRLGRFVVLAAGGLALVGAVGFVVRRAPVAARVAASPEPTVVVAVAVPSVPGVRPTALVPEPQAAPPTALVPEPQPEPPAPPVSSALVLAAPSVPPRVVSVAVAAAAAPVTSARNSAMIPTAKPLASASAGPFLRAAAAASAVAAPQKPKAKHVVSALPASGL
jgi:hypothetical protein